MATTAVDRLTRTWQTPPTLADRLSVVNHKAIGWRFIVTAFFFFIAGGIMALLMRVQLMVPENTFLGPDAFNQMFTMHGTTMMFLFAVPMLEGLGVYIVPLLVGARDMPFPRLNAFGYWAYLFGGIFLFASFFGFVAPDGGWFAYVPLTGPTFSPGPNLDFWLLGVTFVEVSAVVAAIELTALIFKQRARGMSLNRVPLFAWSILIMSLMIILAMPAVITASVLLEMDRKVGTQFYIPAGGGDPLLWQHLFWIFGHPEVYIILLPAVGIVSMIVPVFSRVPIVGYLFLVVSTAAIAFLSFGVWVHHMFATGLLLIPLAFFSAASHMIAIPSGVQVFAWIATIWHGRVLWRVPFMFVLGFIVIFVLGGITGVMVAIIPFDLQVHDSYFVVAHFHYVLIGGAVFPIFAGLHYWLPKMTGKMMSEGLGHLAFWLIFIGFNATFLPMHITGLVGMPRRVYTYLPDMGWNELNMISTIGSLVLGVGFLVFVWNAAQSLLRGRAADDDPWNGGTLEWATTSPPEPYNFRTIPVVSNRNPLWVERPLTPPREQLTSIERELLDSDNSQRETLTTTVLDAEPEGIARLAGPSYWPLVLAGGLSLMLLGILADLYITASLGVLVSIASIAGWLWPSAEERRASRAKGWLPQPSGTASLNWWGTALLIVVLADISALLLFSYFYLRLAVPDWPPAGIGTPELVLPSAALAVLALTGAAVYWAYRGIRRDDLARLRLGLVVALLLGAAFLGMQLFEYLRLDFTPQTNAYGSLFFGISWFHSLLLAVGLGMVAYLLARAEPGYFSARRFSAVQNTALFFVFVVLAWAATFAVLYISPYFI